MSQRAIYQGEETTQKATATRHDRRTKKEGEPEASAAAQQNSRSEQRLQEGETKRAACGSISINKRQSARWTRTYRCRDARPSSPLPPLTQRHSTAATDALLRSLSPCSSVLRLCSVAGGGHRGASSAGFERGTNSRGARGGTRGRGNTRGRGGRGGGGMDNGGMDNGGGAAFVRGGAILRGGATRGRGTRGGTRGGRGGNTRGGGGAGGGGGGGTAVLELSGFPPSLQYQDMVNFINQNAPEGFSYINLKVAGGLGQLTLRASEVSDVMSALHGGSIAPGCSLIVQMGVGGGRSLSQPDKETLRNMVRQAYDQNGKTLNLASMASYNGGQNFINFQNSAFTTELLNTISAIAPDVITLNLSSNFIQSLSGLTGLIRVIPNLANLSLANNQINSVEQLEHLSGFKEKLVELILTSNPFSSQFTSAPGIAPLSSSSSSSSTQLDYTVYQQYISSIFPQIKRLDGHSLTSSLIDFDLPLSFSLNGLTSLPPQKDSFFDSSNHQSMIFAFVNQFFGLFDNDRGNRNFFAVYHDHACFSLQYQPDSKYSQMIYTTLNRNIVGFGGLGPQAKLIQEQKCLKIGPVAICAALVELPSTKHDISNFIADVCKIPSGSPLVGNLLHVNIKGNFIEKETIIRHFHRTFLLSPPTQDAQRNGWPVCILHDTLYIGATHRYANAPANQMNAAAAAGGGGAGVSAVTLSQEDQVLVARLMQATAINQATAMQMLLACQGNIDAAVQQVIIMKQQGLL